MYLIFLVVGRRTSHPLILLPKTVVKGLSRHVADSFGFLDYEVSALDCMLPAGVHYQVADHTPGLESLAEEVSMRQMNPSVQAVGQECQGDDGVFVHSPRNGFPSHPVFVLASSSTIRTHQALPLRP